MNDFIPETYFVDGGTLRANTPSYVKRPADDELFEALLNREYCYVLTPRQMGKSSLMIRTSQRLKDQGIQSAVVDIQGIGTNKIREWYASLLSRIRRGLKLSVDIDEWMMKKGSVGFGQMFSDFIQDVVLMEIADPIVIFLDEVDWMIKIDFRDDFFASIRSMYNARAEYPEFNRISFVLLGVASPADLISEPTRTPFNIGHSIPLQELSFEDAVPLQGGLERVCPGEGEAILRRIFYWTNGHPYLTQKICKTIAESRKADWPDAEVDDLVGSLFLAEEARKESNLKFIQDRILSNSQFAQMLNLYKRVRRTRIKESGQSVIQNQLMLSGLLTVQGGHLEVRNLIYQTVFNERWINRNLPKNWQKVALIALSSLMVLVFVVLGHNYSVNVRLKTYLADYLGGNARDRMNALANIYRMHYLFSDNTNIYAKAAQAFYEFTLDSEAQSSIFPEYGVKDPIEQKNLVSVVRKLYVTMANVDEENDNTSLLRAMFNSLQYSNLTSDVDKALQNELDAWIKGRTKYNNNQGDIAALNEALIEYTNAININPNNQATLYERAKVYIALNEYDNALKDLDAAIGAAKQSAPDIPPSPTPMSSPIPPSETPVFPPQPSNSTQISVTPPNADDTVPIKTFTPTVTPISITPTPSPSPESKQAVQQTPDKFESNFTTLDHVNIAIINLVNETPALQQALQSPAAVYSNLDSVGPVKAFLKTAPPLASVTDFSGTNSNPALELATLADPTTYIQANQVITFTYVIKNTGANTLGPAQFVIHDDRMGALNCGAVDTTLATNQSLACTVTYTTTDSDAGANQLTFNTTVSGGGATSNQAVNTTITNKAANGGSSSYTPGSTIPHQVNPGEWLAQIARCYGADLGAVQNANPQISDPNADLLPLQVVTVPNIGSNGTIYGPPCVTYYTVGNGDTWDSIAQKFNADVAALQEVNKDAGFAVGIKVKIPLNSAGGILTLTSTSVPTLINASVFATETARAQVAGLSAIRSATEQFHNVANAQAAGYSPMIGSMQCNQNLGGAGIEYINIVLIDTTVDLLQPEALIYIPGPNGSLQLGAVEYVVPAAAWKAVHKSERPQLLGQDFYLNSGRGIYILHVWSWKDNPSGMFEDFNPTVSCV